MKTFVCTLLFVIFCLFSCSSGKQADASAERESLIASIDSLEKKMFNRQSMEMDKELAAKEIQLYQNFVKKFRDDSLSAEYLFRSSDLARALGDSSGSIGYLSQICNNYPAYKKIPECIFLQGYYCQEFFGDTTQAKSFYNQLISKYPGHAFVDDAKALMQMFGKSEQDIINDFEKKAGEKKKI
ncbi:MAG: tetratricopeptide repeat protein [Bacteroidetes bacterium]|nr:MAG: tetratricopeptide repeat protein [Bacteroidota bacterium]